LAFALKKPVDRITASTSACVAAASTAAVGQRLKRSTVTAFTRLSVHWAERIVAINS
jgi:hypothetical protein